MICDWRPFGSKRYHAGWILVVSVIVLTVLSAALAFHATRSLPPWENMLIKHKWDAIPEDWVSLGQPPNDTTIKLHIALKANSESALNDVLLEVSHPRHAKYGMHLSREQVAELIAPHPDTLELVYSWLNFSGVPPSSISMTDGGSWLTVSGVPIFQANKILGASYEFYYHTWTNETILRTASYALPKILHSHVKTIAPTTAFTSTRVMQRTPLRHSGGEAAQANVTSGETSDVLSRVDKDPVEPSFLRWLYSMPDIFPAPTDRNKLGIAGLSNEFPNQNDLLMFIAKYRTDLVRLITETQVVTVIPVNGGVDDRSPPGVAANIDTQYSVALTFPTPIEYYTIGGAKVIDPGTNKIMDGDHYLEWLRYMTALENVPRTISVPYFTRELDLPTAYVHTLCKMFEVLGVRGVSVLVASGDSGVGRNKGRRMDKRFSTSFPASCPWVTSVGGTTGFNPEQGSRISGGGFSDFFARPKYQDIAVPRFLDSIESLYAGYFNPSGRAIPDIAMQSTGYQVIFQGQEKGPTSSTSFSTNTAAAIITLLNDFLVSHGKNPLGFLNIWLYEAGLYWDGLNDVIGGNNPGSDTIGFTAGLGWDPVTGLGSLNYTLLERHLIKWARK